MLRSVPGGKSALSFGAGARRPAKIQVKPGVGPKLQCAKQPIMIDGDPLPVRLSRSRTVKRSTVTRREGAKDTAARVGGGTDLG